MDIIRKDKYNIIYNHNNEHIPADFGFYESDDEEPVDVQDNWSIDLANSHIRGQDLGD